LQSTSRPDSWARRGSWTVPASAESNRRRQALTSRRARAIAYVIAYVALNRVSHLQSVLKLGITPQDLQAGLNRCVPLLPGSELAHLEIAGRVAEVARFSALAAALRCVTGAGV
jgi:hypothetical protein